MSFILPDSPNSNVIKPYTKQQQQSFDYYEWLHEGIERMLNHFDCREYEIGLLLAQSLQVRLEENGLLSEQDVNCAPHPLTSEAIETKLKFSEVLFSQCGLGCQVSMEAHYWADVRDACTMLQRTRRAEADREFLDLVKTERTCVFLMLGKIKMFREVIEAHRTVQRWKEID